MNTFLNFENWNSTTIAALVSAVAAAASAVFAFWPLWKQSRTRKLLVKSFGSDLYSPEVLERSTRFYVPPPLL